MPDEVSYEGLELKHIIVGPPGEHRGRRTTHWCTCKCGNPEPFLVTRLDIQQALKGNGNPRCANCMRQRPAKVDLIGQTIGACRVLERLPNMTLPGGRTELAYLVRCQCERQSKFKVRYSELKRGFGGKRTFNCGCKRLDLTGQRFGFWLVLGPTERPEALRGDQQRWWLVECQASRCGTRKAVTTSNLRSRRGTQHCGCQAGPRQTQIWEQKRESLLTLGIKKLRKGILNKARRRHIEFDLSQEDCDRLLFSPCFYCGARPQQHTNIEIYRGKSGGRDKNERRDLGSIIHGGVDRIYPASGYIASNVCPACKYCNWFKSDLTPDQFAQWINSVTNRIPSLSAEAKKTGTALSLLVAAHREPIDSDAPALASRYPVKLRRFIEKQLYYALQQRYKFRFPAELAIEPFLDLLYRRCTYCGHGCRNEYKAHTVFGPKRFRSSNLAYRYTGLDRVDPLLPYSIVNVTPCCAICNNAKRVLSPEQFFSHVRRIQSHWGPTFADPNKSTST